MLKGKWLIAVITMAALLLNDILSLCVLEPTYEAKAAMMVVQSDIKTSAIVYAGAGLENNVFVADSAGRANATILPGKVIKEDGVVSEFNIKLRTVTSSNPFCGSIHYFV